MLFKTALVDGVRVEIPDLRSVTFRHKFKPFWRWWRVKSVSLIGLGRGDYLSDLIFYITSPSGFRVAVKGNLCEDDWAFHFIAKTNAFKGEKVYGEWVVKVADVDEEDTNWIDYLGLEIEAELFRRVD